VVVDRTNLYDSDQSLAAWRCYCPEIDSEIESRLDFDCGLAYRLAIDEATAVGDCSPEPVERSTFGTSRYAVELEPALEASDLELRYFEVVRVYNLGWDRKPHWTHVDYCCCYCAGFCYRLDDHRPSLCSNWNSTEKRFVLPPASI